MDIVEQPTGRFTDRVADYVAARPTYPDALVHLLRRELGLGDDAVIVDVGSGTGLSAEPFLRHGHTVVCVEPNDAMRAAAKAALGRYAGFRSVAGTAEATTLPDASADAVLVAQAFHWFGAAAAKRELARILVPGGRVCLAWNTRRIRGVAFLEGYERLLRTFGTDYDAVEARTARVTAEDSPVLAAFFDGVYTRHVLENAQELDLEGLKQRVRSASYTPPPGSPRHDAMMAALTELFEAEARDRRVRLTYDLRVFCGRP